MKSNLSAIAVSSIALFAALSGGANASDLGGLKDGTSHDGGEYRDVNWTRAWGALLGGYGMTNSVLDAGKFHDLEGTITQLGGEKLDGLGAEGIFGELQVGADYQMGQFVVGAFALASLSDAESEISKSWGGEKATIEQGESYGVGLRGGVLINPKTLAYLAGGWRWTNFELNDLDETIDLPGQENHGFEETRSGPFVETGLEGRINKTMGWKVFGRYTFYDDLNFSDRTAEKDCWEELNVETGELQVGAGLTLSLGY